MAVSSIDFSSIIFDLKEISESRLLSQFYDSKILKLLLGAFTSEIQELSTAITNLIKGRTLSNAEGEQLNAIGRIVGQDRMGYNYDADYWFAPDLDGVCPDNGFWWVQNEPQAVLQEMDDGTYRKWLWLKILENHNLYSSNPEIKNQILEGIQEVVGIEKVDPMEADIYVSKNISLTNKALLTYNKNTKLTDNDYMVAYPATTNINEVIEES